MPPEWSTYGSIPVNPYAGSIVQTDRDAPMFRQQNLANFFGPGDVMSQFDGQGTSGGRDLTVAEMLGGERPFEGLGKTSLDLLPLSTFQPVGQVEAVRAAANAPKQPGFAEGLLGGLTDLLTGVLPGYVRDPLRGIAGTIGQVLDIPIEGLGHVPLPFVPSREQAFGMLPMTEEKRQVQQYMLSDPNNAANYMAAYIREHEGDLMSVQGLPRTLAGLLRPDATIFERMMAVMGVPSDMVARTFAGTDFRNVAETLMNVDPSTLNPVLAELVRRRKAGETTEDQFLDDLTASGFGFSNDVFGNFVTSMLTDPALILTLGTGAAARVVKSAAVAGRNLRAVNALRDADSLLYGAMEARVVDREIARLSAGGRTVTREQAIRSIGGDQINNLIADEIRLNAPQYMVEANRSLSRTQQSLVAMEPVIQRLAGISDRMNSPMGFFGVDRIGRAFNTMSADEFARGAVQAYGPRRWRRYMAYGRALGPDALARLEKAAGTALGNSHRGYYQRSLVRNVTAGLMKPDIAATPNQLVRAAGDVYDPALRTGSEAFTRHTMPEFIPTGVSGEEAVKAYMENQRGIAARKYEAITGTARGSADNLFRDADRTMLALADSHYFGHATSQLKQAQRLDSSALEQKLKVDPTDEKAAAQLEWVKRATLVGPRELTLQRAKQVLKDANKQDVAAVRRSIAAYDILFNNFGSVAIDVEELLADIKVFLRTLIDDNGLITTVGRDALPDNLKDFLDANVRVVGEGNAYQVGLAPLADQHWRVVKDKHGHVTGVNPWVDLVDEQSALFRPTRLDQIRSSLFAPIRGERLLWNAHRQFRRIAVERHKLSRAEADDLFYAIRRAGTEQEVQPRGLSQSTLWRVANEQKNIDKGLLNRLGDRGLAQLVAQAFEGDVMEVGLTSKFTGWSKTRTARWGNFVGVVAEKIYPMVRFSKNPIFQLQELVEPWLLNIVRGIKPGIKWRPEDRAALSLIDRFNLGDQFTDQSEYVHIVAQGWANTTNRGFGRGQELAVKLNTNRARGVQEVKRLNYARQFRLGLGVEFKQAVLQAAPHVWPTLEREFKTTDPALIAQRYFIERGHVHPDDPDFVRMQSVATVPGQIGASVPVHLEGLARTLGFPEGADGLRQAVQDQRLTEDMFTSDIKRLVGWDDDYAKRAWKVASFQSAKTFYKEAVNALMASGRTRKEAEQAAKIMRALDQGVATTTGKSLEEYLSTRYSNTHKFLTSQGQIPADAFTQSLDTAFSRMVTPSGLPVRVYRRGTPEFDRVQARALEFSAPTDPTRAADAMKAGAVADARKESALPTIYRKRDEKGNPVRVAYSLDSTGAEHFVFGESTVEQGFVRAESILTPDAILDAGRWYDEMVTLWHGFAQSLDERTVQLLHDYFEQAAPGVGKRLATREEIAARLHVAWAATQHQASVLEGFRHVMHVVDWMRRLERSGKVRDVLTGGALPAVKDRLDALVAGQVMPNAGLAQKLSDFFDSLMGKRTRTLTGGEDGLQPAAVDVWMGRWFGGVVDEKYIDEMAFAFREKNFEGRKNWTSTEVRARLEKDGVLAPGEKLAKASPNDNVYEFYLRKLNQSKDWANENNWHGRSDWTAADVQAVFWVAQQKALLYPEQSPGNIMAMAGGSVGFDVVPRRQGDHKTYYPSPYQIVGEHGIDAMANLAEDVTRDISKVVARITGAVPMGTVRGSTGDGLPHVAVAYVGTDAQVEQALHLTAYYHQQQNVVATQRPLYLNAKNAYPGGSTSGVVTNWAMDWLLPEDVAHEVPSLLQRYMAEHMAVPDGVGHADDRLHGHQVIRADTGHAGVRGVWEPQTRIMLKTGKRNPWKEGDASTLEDFTASVGIPERIAAALKDGTWVHQFDPSSRAIPVDVQRNVIRIKRASAGEGDDVFADQHMEAVNRALTGGDYAEHAEQLIGEPLLARIGELGGDLQLVRGALEHVREIHDRAYNAWARSATDAHQSAALAASDGSVRAAGGAGGQPWYFQRGPTGVRGALAWDADRRARTYFLKTADAGTGVHEAFHSFVPELDESAKALLIGAYNDEFFPRRLTPYERSVATAVPTSPRQYVVHAGRRADAGAQFSDGVTRTYLEHRYGRAVTVKDRAFYDDPNNRLYLSSDGLAGAAVTPDGDLVSVYKHPDAVVDMQALLAEASRHAQTLDGFDIGGKLPDLYAQHGYRPAARVKFDPTYAPDGWDTAKLDSPDVVLMVKDTEGVSNLPDASKGYAAVKDRVPVFTDWDDAFNVQQEAKRRVAERAPKPVKRGLKRQEDWSREVEEWAADRFMDYVAGSPAPNSVVQPVFNAFGEWARSGKGFDMQEVSPAIRGVFDQFFERDGKGPGATYNLDEYRVVEALRIAISRAEEQAHTTQYFKRGRSWLERSVNHPYLGIYPASYMWGKIVPELVRFLVRKPFGIDAPFAGAVMAMHVYEAVQLQLQTDENFRDFIEAHPQAIRFLQLMVPGLPWDVPVNAPAWLRHYSENVAENQLRAQKGLGPKQNDIADIVTDTVGYAFGPGRFPTTLGDILTEFQAKKEEDETAHAATVNPLLASMGYSADEPVPPLEQAGPDDIWAQVGA